MNTQSKLSRRDGRYGRSVDAVPAVYHLPEEMMKSVSGAAKAVEIVLAHRGYWLLHMFKGGALVGVKPGGKDVDEVMPFVRGTARAVYDFKQAAFICDTSSMHLSPSADGVSCMKKWLGKGGAAGALPVVMLDGLKGGYEISGKTDKRIPAGVFLAGELKNVSGMVSVSVVEPDELAGLSGAIVNLGAGLSSKRGKIIQRTMSAPRVNISKCYKCRKCIHECPVNAISMTTHGLKIDGRRCIFCGRCAEVAHYGGITFDWNATPEHFHKTVSSACSAVLDLLEGRVICINLVFGRQGRERKKHLKGVFVSRDPVAADKAAADFCRSAGIMDSRYIDAANAMLAAAAASDTGSIKYRTVQVAY